MATNMNEISIPVRLKVLLESVASFLKILDNLLPNTKSWHDLNKLINSMSAEALKLLALLSKPFSSLQLFNSTEKTIDKLEEAAARVSIVMQGLKFSDIKLTPAQTLELLKFDEEINKIRESYLKLLESTKAKLLSDTNTANLIGGLKGNVLDKSFSEIESAVDRHINHLKTRVEEKNKQYNELVSSKLIGESATKLVTEGLSEESIGSDIFNKYLKTVDGNLTFKSGKGSTKLALLAEIEKRYSIEPGELQAAIEKGLGKSINLININLISGFLGTLGEKSTLFSGLIKRGNRDASNLPVISSEMEALRSLLHEYEAISLEIARLRNTEITPASTLNDAKVAELTGRLHELLGSILGSAAAMGNYKTGAALMLQANAQLRGALQETNALFLRLQTVLNSFNSMKMAIANFMGFYLVLNLTKRAIKDAANHIKELDSVMNKISIVTDMDTSDLWGLIDLYSKMAQTYGTTIKGAYEVSLIYYQQGLDTADVLNLTNETLKLAKVSGLDYAATTDYMTTALRGFKMEMSEAATVVDVYSNLAANTAVSLEELAVAMSKTASSMESVGSSFQETSAMIATMVAVTRESATNIGSALKSIAARYGEMKSDPLAMTDSEGEELVYNKVDAALLSVGITLKDTEGQFRNFTDVITELAEKWNLLESTQQRYIATLFAGNRQQSRFLALVSNKDLLAENLSVAENSEDIGTVQALKALDSLESKIEQVRVAYLQFYTTIGIESVWKGFLDGTKSVINTLNGMPKLFGKIPISAINAIMLVISLIKNIGYNALSKVANEIGPILALGVNNTTSSAKEAGEHWIKSLIEGIKSARGQLTSVGSEINSYLNQGFLGTRPVNKYNVADIALWQNSLKENLSSANRLSIAGDMSAMGYLSTKGMQEFYSSGEKATKMLENFMALAQLVATRSQVLSNSLQNLGSAFSLISLAINTSTRGGKVASGAFMGLAGTFLLLSVAAKASEMTLETIPWYKIASGIISIVSAIGQVYESFSPEAALEEATAKAEELSNRAKELKANYNTIDTTIKKIKKLEDARYDSAEAAEEYLTAVESLTKAYPQLILSYNTNGEAVLNTTLLENTLAEARRATAEATLAAVQAEAEETKALLAVDKKNIYTSNDGMIENIRDNFGRGVVRNDQYFSAEAAGDINTLYELFNTLDDAVEHFERDGTERITSTISDIYTLAAKYGLEFTGVTRSFLDNIETAVNTFETHNASIEASNKLISAAYINLRYALPNKDNIFSNNDAILTYASEYLSSTISGAGKDFTKENLIHYGDLLFNGLDLWWTTLNDYEKNALNEIFQNPEKYTLKDLLEKGKELGIDLEKKAGWLVDIFTNRAIENTDTLLNLVDIKFDANSNAAAELKKELNAEKNSVFKETAGMSSIEALFYHAIIEQASLMESNGMDASSFVTDALKVYGELSTMPAQMRNNLILQFIDNGFTKEGLKKTLQYINDNDNNLAQEFSKFDGTEGLLSLIDNTISNTIATVLATTEGFKSNWEDIDKLMSKMTGGFDMSSMDSTLTEAEKYGIKIEDTSEYFLDKNGKKILKESKIADVYNLIRDHYLSGFSELVTNMQEDAEAALKIVPKLVDENTGKRKYLGKSESVAAFRTALSGRFEEFFRLDKNNHWILREEKSEADLQEAINTLVHNAETGVLNLTGLLESWAEQMTLLSHWDLGDYSTFAGADNLYANAETAYNRIRELARGGIKSSDEAVDQNLDKAVETYTNGWNNVLNDLNNLGLDYVKLNLNNYKGINFLTEGLLNENGEILTSLLNLTQIAALNAGKTVAEVNNEIAKAITKMHAPNMLLRAMSDLLKGGFTTEEFSNYINTYFEGTDLLQFFNPDTGEFSGELAGLFNYDTYSGNIKLAKGKTLNDVNIAFLKAGIGIILLGSRLWNELVSSTTSDMIADLDAEDTGKQMASGISSLSSAKVGTRVDLSKSPELQAKLQELGYNVTDGYYEVTSEYARDSMLLLLESTNAEINATLKPLQELINQKRAKGTGLKGVISKTFNTSAFKSFISSIGYDADKENLANWADAFGFDWDELTLLYRATKQVIAPMRHRLALMKADPTANKEAITELETLINLLELDLDEDPALKALTALLSNAENAADAIAEFKAQFGDKINIDDFTYTDKDGNVKVKIEELRAAMKTAGLEEYDKFFESYIDLLKDNYINNISKAGSLLTQGTTSLTDISAFKEAYTELTKGTVDVFYDYVLNAWTISAADMQTYIESAANKLGLTGKAKTDYVNALIKALTVDTLDFSKYLSGSASTEDLDILKRNLKNYYETHKPKEYGAWSIDDLLKWVENIDKFVADDLETLSQGGTDAVKKILSYGKELSTEEIEAAYRALVAPIKAVADSLNELKVNSIVAKNLIEILNTAGFTVDENGVVTAVGDMVKAYKSIYNLMKAAGEATTTELNNTYAQLLTAQDQRNIDITETLKNGAGMSYSDFGSLLAKYNIKFEDYMRDHWDTVMRDGFGNIRITDWEGFAKNIFKTDNLDAIKNTDEYVSAFKAYNDGLIELNKNAELAIVDEIKQIESAKAGDWLNFSELWTKLESAWETIDFKTAVPNYKGNVPNMGHRVIVPGKIMDLYFGGHNGWGTIFGEDVAFRNFGETYANIGATFANLTEEGKKAPNIADYAKELYTMAISRVGGDASKVTADLIKQIDAEEENLILNIKDFGDSIKPEEVLNALWEESDLYHKAEELAYSAAEVINASLQMYGASLEDGILKIGEDTNLLGVAQVLLEASEMAGLEIGNGLEEVKDTVLNILKSYSEAITKGISGGLTAVDANDLVQKALNFGITDLQFNETAEGFLLAESSAIKLYLALKSIDALHSAEAFNALSESLLKTNDNFKSTSALIAHINNIRNGTYAADDKISNARKEQYQLELEIAEEILRVRATSEDDSFNFMDLKIPAAQNNPLNYWKGWEKALTAINKSKKTGRMDYSDFYNLMTELGNLSSMIGGKGILIGKNLEVNSENFLELIAKGAANLTATAKDTELKVALPKIDVDFSSADNFAKDVDLGILLVADAQIEMLDGLIALLETIVAMEKLNDITDGGEDDNIIDLGDIFPEIQFDAEGNVIDPEALEYVDDYAKFLEYILDKAKHNKDLEKALSEIKLDGISLDKIFGMTPQQLGAKGEDFIKAYTSLLEGLRQASISGNYDVDNIMTSVQEVLAESGLTGFTVDTGKTTLVFEAGTMTEINWEDLDTAEILKKVTARMHSDEDTAKQAILNAEKSYKQGKGTGNLKLEEVLTVENKIKIDPKTGEKSVTVGNETYNLKDRKWLGALEAQSLLNMGIDSKNILIESDRALATEYHIGNKSNITVEAKQGITTITGTGAYGETITGNSQDEWLKNYVSSFREQSLRYGETEAAKWTDSLILWRTLEIRVNTETKVIDEKGNKIDISNDAARRQEITDLRNLLQLGIAAKDLGFLESGDGNWTKTLDAGGTLVIDGSKIGVEVEGNNANAQFISELDSALGIDQALSDTIAAGIGKAFSDLSTNLDSIDSSKISSLASALLAVASALANIASQDIEKLIEQIKGLQSAAENQNTKIDIPENKKDRVIANAENIDGSEVENALTNIVHGAAEAVAKDNTFKETTGKTGESGGLTLVDKFAKELSNLAEQVLPLLTLAALQLSKQTAIMGEAGQTLGKAIVEGIAEGMLNTLQVVQAINPLLLGMAAGIAGIGLTSVLLVPLQIILEAIAEKLGEIKENSNIDIKIQADADVAGELQKVIDKLKELAELADLNPEDNKTPEAPGGTPKAPSGTPKQSETTNQGPTQESVIVTNVDVSNASISGALPEVAAAKVNASNVGPVAVPIALAEEVKADNNATVKVNVEADKDSILQDANLTAKYDVSTTGDIPKNAGPFETIYNISHHGDNIPGPAGPFHVHYYIHNHGIPGGGGVLSRIGALIGGGSATGNFGLAKAKGTKTLMGELGPELVVSNGRYFVAGQNGAEMVNLDDDAIVFNHLQTKLLLKNGMSNGRGRAVTNERNAVAFATGNAEGPAMASASAALNALKQLRAMWESLRKASISDLAGAGGGGGGGGGGGDNAKIVDPSIWVDTVERWYNLMQKIAKLEKEITHEEKLRSKLSSDWTANGNHYYASQKRSLEALRDLIDAQEQLNLSREAYYDQRVEALKNLPFGQLIEFDNEGQMRFKENAMDWLTNLVGFDQNGKANYTDEEKYNILLAAGYGDYMKYDSSGGEIKMDDDNDGEVTDEERLSFFGEATLAFWDKINDYKDATQSLWDSIKEGEDSILQLQADQNELLAEIRENQMAVEDAVLDAIEDMRQREIDALLDERDKLEESTLKYIDGLSDALNREQEMYLNLEDENSLNQLKRRLAILQRSGGSAEDIANLRSEIDSSERERYFNLQQLQIDAILRASDLEIERMDSLIELMTEALDYLKEYGLLWGNVYEVMEGTAAQITSFIIHGNSEFWALSPLGTSDQANQTLFKAELWSSYRKDLNDVKEKIGNNEVTTKDIRDNMALMVTMTRRQLADTDYTIFDEAMKAEFGEDYDPNSAYKQLFYDDYMGHGDVTRATATARAKYAADKKAAEDAAAAALAAAAVPAAEEHHGGEPSNGGGCPDCATNCGGGCYNACENHCAQGCKGDCNGGCKLNCDNVCAIECATKTSAGKFGTISKVITGNKKAAAGGYVNHGIYELGERGTETVLTASLTKILRDNILSNRPNSLISLLKSYNEGYDGINNSVSGVTPVEDNSTVIEKVELNMEVKQIANDYDARRAGEQALNEMMRIARKTGAANSIRR